MVLPTCDCLEFRLILHHVTNKGCISINKVHIKLFTSLSTSRPVLSNVCISIFSCLRVHWSAKCTLVIT